MPKRSVGRPKFEPRDDQRQWVKLGVAAGITHEEMARVIVNPQTGRGIGLRTFRQTFRREIETARQQLIVSALAGLMTNVRNGSVRAQTWVLERMAPELFGPVSPQAEVDVEELHGPALLDLGPMPEPDAFSRVLIDAQALDGDGGG